MVQAIRNNLSAVGLQNGKEAAHAGLALEKSLANQVENGENKDRSELFEKVVGISVPQMYFAAYDRWKDTVQQMPCVRTVELEVSDRLVVGLGGESVLENSVTLHKTFGVPYIPGSALKGMARHYCEQQLGEQGKITAMELFGYGPDTDKKEGVAAGAVFFDAWYIPAKGEIPLRQDIITVHHQNYYSKMGKDACPSDFDDPVPVGFISAVGKYLIAVQSCGEEWADFAIELLKKALADYGVGAKTSSGYGRLVDPSLVNKVRPPLNTQDRSQAKPRNKEVQEKPVHVPVPSPVVVKPEVSSREMVTIVPGGRPGKEKVRTHDGFEIPCLSFPPWKQKDKFKAEVTRQDGKAIKAVFKGWQ